MISAVMVSRPSNPSGYRAHPNARDDVDDGNTGMESRLTRISAPTMVDLIGRNSAGVSARACQNIVAPKLDDIIEAGSRLQRSISGSEAQTSGQNGGDMHTRRGRVTRLGIDGDASASIVFKEGRNAMRAGSKSGSVGVGLVGE